jgi:hypothetical protein
MENPFDGGESVGIAVVLAAYEQAAAHLRQFGFRSNASARVGSYLRTMSEHKLADTAALGDNDRYRLANAVCEGAILVDAASLPPAYLLAMRDRLRIINSGPEIENIERPDPGRDSSVELQVAARSNLLGGLGLPATARGDVLVRAGGSEVPVEVKRISSVERVRQRTKEAVSQLLPATASDVWGVVLLDVSAPIRLQHGFLSTDTDQRFMDVSRQQTTSFIHHYVNGGDLVLEDVAREGVLGVIVRNVSYGWVGGPGNVRRVISTQAMCVWEPGSREDLAFADVMRVIETGQPELGTEEEMAAASISIPMRERKARGED